MAGNGAIEGDGGKGVKDRGVPNSTSTRQKGILLIGILVLFALTGIAFEDSELESVVRDSMNDVVCG